jgi:hypothetical protein
MLHKVKSNSKLISTLYICPADPTTLFIAGFRVAESCRSYQYPSVDLRLPADQLAGIHPLFYPIVRVRSFNQHGESQLSWFRFRTDASPKPMYGNESVSAPKPQFDMGE